MKLLSKNLYDITKNKLPKNSLSYIFYFDNMCYNLRLFIHRGNILKRIYELNKRLKQQKIVAFIIVILIMIKILLQLL